MDSTKHEVLSDFAVIQKFMIGTENPRQALFPKAEDKSPVCGVSWLLPQNIFIQPLLLWGLSRPGQKFLSGEDQLL